MPWATYFTQASSVSGPPRNQSTCTFTLQQQLPSPAGLPLGVREVDTANKVQNTISHCTKRRSRKWGSVLQAKFPAQNNKLSEMCCVGNSSLFVVTNIHRTTLTMILTRLVRHWHWACTYSTASIQTASASSGRTSTYSEERGTQLAYGVLECVKLFKIAHS